METSKKILQKIIVGLFFILTACIAEEGPFVTEIEIIDVSFATDIQPIFNNNCIVCHDQNHFTGLDLQEGSSYNLLVNVTSAFYAPNLRVEPLSLENSVLWHKIIGDDVFGGIMPPGEHLSNFDIEKIESWIDLGALNN
ncbi:MAG: hypothetical protein DRI75_11145 [Bacteroidetes bacterium]|nr:MAG: hypothetical protein DRI75_11145 [Bacteroidota bacterium]